MKYYLIEMLIWLAGKLGNQLIDMDYYDIVEVTYWHKEGYYGNCRRLGIIIDRRTANKMNETKWELREKLQQPVEYNFTKE